MITRKTFNRIVGGIALPGYIYLGVLVFKDPFLTTVSKGILLLVLFSVSVDCLADVLGAPRHLDT